MIKRMMWGVLGLLLSGLAVVMWADNQTSRFSRPYISHNLHELPAQKVALVLGTSPKLVDGRDNWYFNYRIQAAVELYQQGKVQHIIVSGDNRRHTYNEPDMMAAALVKQGVPANKITADYAGLRTLDSVLRARDIFGQQRYIVVSQSFHNERAVYLARSHGIEAYGYNARDVRRYAGLKTQIREYGARVKMFLDLWSNKQPKHGGEAIALPE